MWDLLETIEPWFCDLDIFLIVETFRKKFTSFALWQNGCNYILCQCKHFFKGPHSQQNISLTLQPRLWICFVNNWSH